MRIVFMGTPDFAVPVLTELVARGHEIAAVYTQPPRPAGRGQAERKSPVHLAAEGFGLLVLTPKNFRNEADRLTFAAHEADIAVVVAYGLLLPEDVIDAPIHGCLNLHGSALPRWRGAAPIQRAIMEGDTSTGVCVMRLVEALDAGPVALMEAIPIGKDMTAGELHDEMARCGADLMARALATIERGGLSFTEQHEAGVTYARKIDKSETRIDWSRPGPAVHNHIRGLSPSPGAWFELAGGTRVKVLRSTLKDGQGAPGTVLDIALTIACGQDAVRLLNLQREGKSSMDAAAFLRGTDLPPGTVLG
jgi:methionyl-tRNA formyltransferase